MASAETFWRHVDKSPGLGKGECWIWTASTDRLGYGRVGGGSGIGQPSTSAHRYSWEISVGKIPKGIYVCHKCDVRNCVRPDHLFLGTQRANVADAIKKGRHAGSVTHCPAGHAYDARSLKRNGSRECRKCVAQQKIASRMRTYPCEFEFSETRLGAGDSLPCGRDSVGFTIEEESPRCRLHLNA